MRTTIQMSDDLYRQAKTVAAREGRTVGELIESAVRVALAVDHHTGTEIEDLPTYGGSGLLPRVDLDDRRELADLMDMGTPTDALR